MSMVLRSFRPHSQIRVLHDGQEQYQQPGTAVSVRLKGQTVTEFKTGNVCEGRAESHISITNF